ncbi:MAG TPA: hypothetical protein VFT15_04630 [Chitinophagaceae bacterium]|nr:hypothetical protein [Chitinophagaceae bacterium]
MLKRIFILAFFLNSIVFCFAQVKTPVKRSYGYKQASIPGIVPRYEENRDIQPTSNKTKPKQTYNYWFYLELSKTEKIDITGLWISGVQHDIKTEIIKDLPVRKIIFTGLDKNDTTIMVPVTKNKVVLVYPSGETNNKKTNSNYIRQLTSKNELVIRYSWKKQTHYSTVKNLKEINPDVRP